MDTIESRLAALEKLYYNQSIQLATCRLEVTALQDIAIISGKVIENTFFNRSSGPQNGTIMKACSILLPSEPTSAAARQLLGLPVKEVRMQEEPEQTVYGPNDHERAKRHIGKWVYFINPQTGEFEKGKRPLVQVFPHPHYPYSASVGNNNALLFSWFRLDDPNPTSTPEPTDDTDPSPNRPEPKQRDYPALRWDEEGYLVSHTSKIRFGYVSLHKPNTSYTAAFWHNGGTNSNFFDTRESARQWVETQFREWFDSLFDQPK